MMALSDKVRQAIQEVPDFPSPGINFKDITPILADPDLCKEIISQKCEWIKDQRPDVIVGLESRGFFFGFHMALSLNIPFVSIRKSGKLPREVYSERYDLEYGSAVLELHKGDISPNSRVIIHDDLLATGGTVKAATNLIKQSDASVIGYDFLIELGSLRGRNLLDSSLNINSLVFYD